MSRFILISILSIKTKVGVQQRHHAAPTRGASPTVHWRWCPWHDDLKETSCPWDSVAVFQPVCCASLSTLKAAEWRQQWRRSLQGGMCKTKEYNRQPQRPFPEGTQPINITTHLD